MSYVGKQLAVVFTVIGVIAAVIFLFVFLLAQSC